MTRIAVFGGAFDPPTIAHEEIIEAVSASGGIDDVWVMPCLDHPLGKRMATFEHRVAMCHLAFAKLDGMARVTTVAAQAGSNKTFDILEFLSGRFADVEFMPVVGLDEANQICLWHRWQDLVSKYTMIVVERADEVDKARGLELFYWRKHHVYVRRDPPIPRVSSSQARAVLTNTWSDPGEMYSEQASGIMSRPVFDHAVRHGLYGAARP